MKKYIQHVLVTTVISISSYAATADIFTPGHSCSKPSKPYQFTSQWEIESFNSDVESYKRCISDFVDEMNDAARKHNDAASEAIDEWNSFVNYELN